MKKIIDRFFPVLVEKVGGRLNPVLLKLKSEQRQLLVFCFHGIYASSEEKEAGHVDPQNNVTVDQLGEFIAYFLSHGYQFIRPEDLLNQLPGDRPYAILTFDDGYFNNSLAIQVLEEYEAPATFFVTTRNVVENRSYWWDIIYKYRKRQGVGLEAIRQEQEGLKTYKSTYIDDYVTKHFGRDATVPWSDIDRPFTPAELRAFAQHPWVSIGNHTKSHAILTNCDRDEIRDELITANEMLRELTGRIPISTAFPNGNYNDLILEVARTAGFRLVFTTESKLNYPDSLPGDFGRLGRFMAETGDINERGGFWRVGYTAGSLYSGMKERVKAYKVGSRKGVTKQ